MREQFPQVKMEDLWLQENNVKVKNGLNLEETQDEIQNIPNDAVKPQIKLRLVSGKPFFGPGTYQLLTLIGKTGSLQDACHSMQMSYSKGSRMIKDAERQLGFPLTERWAGGTGGGGSRLTQESQRLLIKYQDMLSDVQEYTERAYQKYFREV